MPTVPTKPRRNLRRTLATALVLSAAVIGAALPARAAEITFLVASDIDRAEADEGRGGFARLAGAIAAERARGGNLVVAHAGDSISPSLLSGFDKGAHIVELLDMLKLDVFVPGNHEFDFGKDVFLARVSELEAGHRLAANLRLPDGSTVAGFADTAMLEFEGIKVGVVGVVGDHSHAVSSPGDLRIAGTVDTALSAAKALRAEGADVVVAVAHAVRSQDLAMMHGGSIDLVLSGDTHDLLVNYDGRSILAEAREQAEYLPVVTLDVTAETVDGKRKVTWTPEFRIVDTATVTPDPAVAAKIAELEKTLSAELDVEVGKTTTELDSRRPAVRGSEAAIGNLIADAMRSATGADVALMNGGGIRANKLYAAGSTLTRRDVLAELPFGNVVVVVELSGADLKAALENGVSAVEDGAGRFPHVSGMAVVADVSKPAGSRIVSVEIGGAPLDPAKTYTVATNDFMARGGDDYVALRNGDYVVGPRDGKLLASVVIDAVAAAGTVSPAVEGRVRLEN
jgi:2',3'-cyclic-nucleotide 2'-phosphodiesterase (5'-nucleotidase family)